MLVRPQLSRRGFVGGVAASVGMLTLGATPRLFATERDRALAMALDPADDYEAFAKLAANENPYGPPESVMKAMTGAFRYANRYGYPDSGILTEIAKHHGVSVDNVLIGAGSGEILDVVGSTFASGGKKVLGVEPTFAAVYQHVTSIKGESITVTLTADFRQDISALIDAAKKNYRELGFVYLCNPNNPTGRIVTKEEVRQLLDGLPEGMPVLIDEAYHHFVDDSNYGSSVPYVIEGRPVIVTRTFSKIAALAGMRLGYAIAPKAIVDQMRPNATGTINALVKYGGVAALKDTASQASVKKITIALRTRTTNELTGMGYSVIPSEGNFFMVDVRRPMQPLIAAFKNKGVLVGRPFPPMNHHLRVSVGTSDEMNRFVSAFKEIVANPMKTAAAGGS
jgi:Histidinol-phosphate/aromatic aminotransferase and cobyric acid decarboxylase